MSESSPAQPFLSTKLLLSLLTVLQTLDANPHPVIQNTPETKRRASVAIILRVRPHYKHWPLPREAEHTWIGDREVQARLPAHESRLRDFFDQRWVKHGDPEVLLIRRAARKGDRWQSHIALPGGHREAADADDRAAAVREAWEEVGVDLGTSNAIPVGDLRQRFVTSVTGTRPIMVLCPYLFLMTRHDIPPLRLQPTEVASAHWVPLRALLASEQRTSELQSIVGHRSARGKLSPLLRLAQSLIGPLKFAAIRLIPAESIYCSSIPNFAVAPADMTVGKPLLLWGLTLGVLSDLLGLLPPYNAHELWTFPSFVAWDTRIILWLITYSRRKVRSELIRSGRLWPSHSRNESSLPTNDNQIASEAMAMSDENVTHSEAMDTVVQGFSRDIACALTLCLVIRVSAIGGLITAFQYYRVKYMMLAS